TQQNATVFTSATKTAVPDLTRAGYVRWDARWRNISGTAGSSVTVTDTVPTQLIFDSLEGPLPATTSCSPSCAVQGAAGDGSGGTVTFVTTGLAADDGTPGSGSDERALGLWMRVKSGVADGTAISNCIATDPGAGGVGSNQCVGTPTAALTMTLAQQVMPAQGGSPPLVSPNDTLRYTLTLVNNAATAQFIRVFDALPADVDYVPGSFQVDGAGASDSAFASNVLSYVSSTTVAAGSTLTLRYDARVRAGAANGLDILNTANATQCTDNLAATSCRIAKLSPQTQARVSATASINGTVYEDVNYGGGGGRSRATAVGVGRPSVRVELYAPDGSFLNATTTDANGAYSFTALGTGDHTVRVVTSTVLSSRTGAASGQWPVQTWRLHWNGSAHAADPSRVGGENPALADAASNTTSATLASLTTGSTPGSATPHSVATVRTSSGAVSGVDFGYHFATVTNTNDAGQGSLRQAITNANALGGDTSLLQAGRLAGQEHLVFMIGNGSSAAGLNSANNFFTTNGGDAMVATITLASVLPTVSTTMAIDAQLQPGWSSGNPRPIIELNGAFSTGNTGIHGLTLSGSGSAARGLIINGFGGRQMHITGGSNVVQGNWLGLNASGTGAPTNGVHGLSVQGAYNVVGGTTAAQRNVASGNLNAGIVLETAGATGNLVIGNYAGTNAAGTAAVPNQQGLRTGSSASGNTFGGSAAGEGNLSSGNSQSGVLIQGGSANSVLGNRIGTNAAGTAALRNTLAGVNVSGGSNHTIGGPAPGQGNLISGNGRTLAEGWADTDAGVVVDTAATGITIAGNTIGLAADGSTALGNGKNGLYITGNSSVTVGGSTSAHRNLIASSASFGILVVSNSTGALTVQNNWLGLAADGSTARGNGSDAIVCASSNVNNCTLTGNVVASSTGYGVRISSGTGHGVRGNYIGTDSTGTLARANTQGGIYVNGTGTTVAIGGTTAAERNVVSGNGAFGIRLDTGSTGSVQGNYVGTDAAGAAALGNSGPGVWLNGAANVAVGGAAAGAGNVIAAQTGGFGNGLRIELASATGNTVYGNLIGSNATNTAALGNAQSGVAFVAGASNNTFGGTAAGQANVVRASSLRGVGFDNTGGVPVRNRISGNSIYGNTLIG
ncbi:MAG: hypothetical protein RJA10_4651, partial [Pseudomonadota bacterium]